MLKCVSRRIDLSEKPSVTSDSLQGTKRPTIQNSKCFRVMGKTSFETFDL